MNQHLLVKIRQLIVAYRGKGCSLQPFCISTAHGGHVGEGREQERKLCNLANRLTKAGPMSEAIDLGLTCDCRIDLANFNFISK